MCNSLTTGPKSEASEMTEKSLGCDIEQADSDVTVTLPKHQPSTLLKELTPSTKPASLAEPGKLCQRSSQITSTVLVVPMSNSMSETEKARLVETDISTPFSTIMSASSEQLDTDDNLFTDIERSRPTTGVTTTSGNTEATSPLIPTLEDQMASSWQGRVAGLSSEEIHFLMTLSNQGFKGTGDGFPLASNQNLFTNDGTSQDPQIGSASFEKKSASSFGNTPEFGIDTSQHNVVPVGQTPKSQPRAGAVAKNEVVAKLATTPASPMAKTLSPSGYNPLALEWRPTTKHSPKVLSASLDGPQLTTVVPELQRFCVPAQIETNRVLEWAKNVLPLQQSECAATNVLPGSVQTKTSLATTPGVKDDCFQKTLDTKSQGNVFVPRHISIPTPSNTTQLHQRSTLAQRRAEKQLGQISNKFGQSASNTALLPSARLHHPLDTSASATTSPSQAVFAPSSQTVQSQPFRQASYTQSLTWKRPSGPSSAYPGANREMARWNKVEQDLLKMGLIKRVPGKEDSGSFAVPRTFEQWLEFRAGHAEDALAENAAKIRRTNLEAEVAKRLRKVHSLDDIHGYYTSRQGSGKRVKIEPAMGGKDFRDGRGTILAHPSTWSPWHQPTEARPDALWPSLEEMKEEGDERHTSAFGRFPALPRVPGNPTVVWKVKPVIPVLPFDEVWQLPNKDTWAELYCKKPKDPDEGYMEMLVGQSLLEVLDD